MTNYTFLLNILDQIIKEANGKYPKKYILDYTDLEKTNQSRSRAFIHLFLQVSFGLISFDEREHFITDGANDGGIDGYYIDKESKRVFFIQSKFRTTRHNFENKNIKLEEILVMDVSRILNGEKFNENGIGYSGKIKQIQDELLLIDDIGRYNYHVIILANLSADFSDNKLKTLTGGYPIQVIDYAKCYDQLVLPVITGTYYNAGDLNINIDLSNKNSGSKISYNVQTRNGDCEITVVFVPTIEIAKLMRKYKNSILKYNPRSYLEFEGQKVNDQIRETILNESTNEFALFNNGITMLSDETYFNERIGQKNKAQLIVKNPQIINGGQTAYTLSKIFEENLNKNYEEIFRDKEVLLKVITLLNNDVSTSSLNMKIKLIDDISDATNRQTAVVPADRFSNENFHVLLQKAVFNRFGILYERKRGEFADGISQNFLKITDIIERNLFFRILFASRGEINKAAERKLFLSYYLKDDLSTNTKKLDLFYFSYLCFKKIVEDDPNVNRKYRDLYGKIFIMTKKYKPENVEDFQESINSNYASFLDEWQDFLNFMSSNTSRVNLTYFDRTNKSAVATFSLKTWYKSFEFESDVKNYFLK